MRGLPILIALFAILLFTTPMIAADAGAGKDLYAKKCASCHNDNGEGKDTIAKMFKVEMKPLGSKEIQSKSDADLKKVILEGSGKMKPVKDVDAKAADDIIAYVRTLAKK
jgi:mono/diheme cytochrome c family protein